jgi:crossover junction endodeoxyribonuclease RuvC
MTSFVGIDPSTKTGLVMLNEQGEAYYQQELILSTGIASTAKELKEYGESIVNIIPEKSIICIEGFSFGSKGQAVSTQYGVGFAIRFALVSRGIMYIEPTPGQVKKFASGKGDTKKENLVLPIFKMWNFEHDSDNVRDAYIMAQMAKSLQKDATLLKYQREVMDMLMKPKEGKKKK